MLQSRKFWLTWLLAGIMLISSAFCAFADDEVGPFCQKALGDGAADAVGGAGDHTEFMFQKFFHKRMHLSFAWRADTRPQA